MIKKFIIAVLSFFVGLAHAIDYKFQNATPFLVGMSVKYDDEICQESHFDIEAGKVHKITNPMCGVTMVSGTIYTNPKNKSNGNIGAETYHVKGKSYKKDGTWIVYGPLYKKKAKKSLGANGNGKEKTVQEKSAGEKAVIETEQGFFRVARIKED